MPIHLIEVFSAGTPLCRDAHALVRRLAGDAAEIRLMNVVTDRRAQQKLGEYKIRSIPAVVLNGTSIVGGSASVDEQELRAAGLGGNIRGAPTDRIDTKGL